MGHDILIYFSQIISSVKLQCDSRISENKIGGEGKSFLAMGYMGNKRNNNDKILNFARWKLNCWHYFFPLKVFGSQKIKL